MSRNALGGALRDIQKTAAKETTFPLIFVTFIALDYLIVSGTQIWMVPGIRVMILLAHVTDLGFLKSS